MEALILTLPTIILLAVPVVLVAFLAVEAAELLTRVESKRKPVKVKAKEENGLFIR
jgi:hypothetical protein